MRYLVIVLTAISLSACVSASLKVCTPKTLQALLPASLPASLKTACPVDLSYSNLGEPTPAAKPVEK